MHLEDDVQSASPLVLLIAQIIEWPRIALGAAERLAAKRLERFERDDPWRHRSRKALGEEWAERLVFPRLQVARRPVIEQHDAEDVLFRVCDSYAFAERVPRPDHEAQLHLVVEPARRTERRRRFLRALTLAVRPRDPRAGH